MTIKRPFSPSITIPVSRWRILKGLRFFFPFLKSWDEHWQWMVLSGTENKKNTSLLETTKRSIIRWFWIFSYRCVLIPERSATAVFLSNICHSIIWMDRGPSRKDWLLQWMNEVRSALMWSLKTSPWWNVTASAFGILPTWVSAELVWKPSSQFHIIHIKPWPQHFHFFKGHCLFFTLRALSCHDDTLVLLCKSLNFDQGRTQLILSADLSRWHIIWHCDDGGKGAT